MGALRRLVFAEPAADDLEAIIDYIALDDPTAAETVYRGIMRAAERLPEFPDLGRPGRYPETRELIVADLPYLIVYGIDDETVVILAVFHTSRDLARALEARMRG